MKTEQNNKSNDCLESIENYYTNKLVAYGPTPAGVDWNSLDGQLLRFQKLSNIIDASHPFTVVDYGCGYAGLFPYLSKNYGNFQYVGYDLSSAMVAAASNMFSKFANFRVTCDINEVESADYVLASGLFNVKLNHELSVWEGCVTSTLENINSFARKSFSFNMLTEYGDRDRMVEKLYYSSPEKTFTRCMKQFSRHVALLHDYELYEFTVLVRK